MHWAHHATNDQLITCFHSFHRSSCFVFPLSRDVPSPFAPRVTRPGVHRSSPFKRPPPTGTPQSGHRPQPRRLRPGRAPSPVLTCSQVKNIPSTTSAHPAPSHSKSRLLAPPTALAPRTQPRPTPRAGRPPPARVRPDDHAGRRGRRSAAPASPPAPHEVATPGRSHGRRASSGGGAASDSWRAT